MLVCKYEELNKRIVADQMIQFILSTNNTRINVVVFSRSKVRLEDN